MTSVDVYAVVGDVEQLVDVYAIEDAYDPSQPRVPKGQEGGGQWTEGGGSGSSGGDDEEWEPDPSDTRPDLPFHSKDEWKAAGVEVANSPALEKLNSLGLSPAEVRDGMMGGHEGTLGVALSTRDDSVMFIGHRKSVYGDPEFEFSRILRDDGTVEHVFFKVDDDLQGSGMARDMLRTQVDMYQKLGMERVTLEANLDVGGYAWAKYGFSPETTLSWRALKGEASRRLDELYRDGSITGDSVAAVRQILSSSDSQSATWRLSDIRTPVTTTFEGDEGPETVTRTLGKELMIGTSWGGKLDLSDATALARFRDYVGTRRSRARDADELDDEEALRQFRAHLGGRR